MDKVSFMIKPNEFLTDFTEKENVIIDNREAASAFHNFQNEFLSIIGREFTPIDISKIRVDSLGRIEIADKSFQDKVREHISIKGQGGSCGSTCNCSNCTDVL